MLVALARRDTGVDAASRRIRRDDALRGRLDWRGLLSTGCLLAAASIWAVGALEYLANATSSGSLAKDFTDTYLPAAQAVLHGRSPYPGLDDPVMVMGQGYVYPPLVAFLSVPLALLPGAALLVIALTALCVPLSLWLLGVRDWRCYVAAFLWMPVFSGIVWGNLTLPLVLGCAAVWRFRDRPAAVSIAGGLTIAGKLIAWPVGLWLVSTRRLRAAAGALAVAFCVTIGLWSLLGFAGLADFPANLHRLDQGNADRVYTITALAREAGLSGRAQTVLWAGVVLLALTGVVVFGRRRDDARSYTCAMVAVIVASPIAWLHSFAFLLVPVALLRPRFSVIWLLPAAMWLFLSGADPSPRQIALTLALAGVVVVAALLPAGTTVPRIGRLTSARSTPCRAGGTGTSTASAR
jgi:hypothetical protein